MAITNSATYWDHISKPEIGFLCMDHYTLQCKVYDGTEWIPVNQEFLEDKSMSALRRMLNERQNLTDEWLETKYDDLKHLREEQEEKYKTLSDKYRVFEILRISGENNGT